MCGQILPRNCCGGAGTEAHACVWCRGRAWVSQIWRFRTMNNDADSHVIAKDPVVACSPTSAFPFRDGPESLLLKAPFFPFQFIPNNPKLFFTPSIFYLPGSYSRTSIFPSEACERPTQCVTFTPCQKRSPRATLRRTTSQIPCGSLSTAMSMISPSSKMTIRVCVM